VEIGLGYTSRRYRLRPGALGNDAAILTGPIPDNSRAAGISPLEGNQHLVTLAGILGDHPPTDRLGSMRSRPASASPTSPRHW
ncbi:MAG: hypothetical protein ACRDTJ_08070, partial [Pseudonocardiaceae bacterium]